jgi:hypothetical protein
MVFPARPAGRGRRGGLVNDETDGGARRRLSRHETDRDTLRVLRTHAERNGLCVVCGVRLPCGPVLLAENQLAL